MLIGELAKRSGASPKAIRLYEQMGLLEDVHRKGNYRVYDDADVAFVQLIKQAQQLGVKLQELLPLLTGRRELDWSAVMQMLAFKQLRNEEEVRRLLQMNQRIESYRTTIQECIDAY